MKSTPTCTLDERILNSKTIGELSDLGITFFASLCGRNRGAFVLQPSDGKTWGCTSFPANFAAIAGANNTDLLLKDANSIKDAFVAGNLTADDTVTILDYFLQTVYNSSDSVNLDPFACEMGGLAQLRCDYKSSNPTTDTIRSVTLAGMFVPAVAVTGGKALTLDEAKQFYTLDDFKEIAAAGLNTVQIPFPVSAFQHYDTQAATIDHLTEILRILGQTGLKGIIELHGEDNDAAVAAASKYAAIHNSTVLGLTVPSLQTLRTARAAAPSLKLFVPTIQGKMKDLKFPDSNTYAAIDLGHSSIIGDVASSTSQDDRMKMFYQEAKACIYRSPLEYSKCFNNIPVFVAKGFDLSIDNCIHYGTEGFIDYGQCDRMNETIDSPWWRRHRTSFASRQIFSYEQGMGWSYTAWKLYDDDHSDLLDSPAKLVAFKNVAAAGLILPLTSNTSDDDFIMSCLNPPVSDFVLGDATLSPTPGPPPDCSPGWWNETIEDCTYWVPPPTDPPTFQPTMEPVICPEPLTRMAEIKSASIGAIFTFIVCAAVFALFGRRPAGYSTIN